MIQLTSVVVAGPASSPITKSISLDLERRGYIVYIVVNSAEEEHQVLSEARVDVRPLQLDIGDVGFPLLPRIMSLTTYTGIRYTRSNGAFQQHST
jgi:hypothetical protein